MGSFETRSHVAQADLEHVMWLGRPSTSDSQAFTTQVLGLQLVLCAVRIQTQGFMYARQTLSTEPHSHTRIWF